MDSLDYFQTIIYLSPAILAVVWAFIKLFFKVKELSNEIADIKEENRTTKSLITEKNDKVYQEVKKLESKFILQNETLIEIKTMMKLFLDNRIKLKDNE
jgi:hypothetical protein